jgi:hypothetical protein
MLVELSVKFNIDTMTFLLSLIITAQLDVDISWWSKYVLIFFELTILYNF